MKIIVLGGGALGSILSAALARSGQEVVLLARGARADFLREQGITVSGIFEDKVQVTIETDPAALPAADLLIVTPKTYDTLSALAPLADLQVDSVISVQNGVLKNEQLADQFGADRTLGCIATISGEVKEDGSVEFSQNQKFHLGELPSDITPRVERLVKVFANAGIAAVANDAMHDGEWSKFIAWMPLMALSVMTRLESGKICADPHSASFAIEMIREGAAIATAEGVNVDDSGPLPAASICSGSQEQALAKLNEMGQRLLTSAPNHRMSALQDLTRGKRLEVDETLGYLTGLADQHKLAAPAIKQAWQLVKAIDSFNH
ncbi:MAG: 2-dehydropantoate 2-reductase [Gammaproteobacteria bacterium]